MKKILSFILAFFVLIFFYFVFVIDRILMAFLAKTSVSFKTWYEVDEWVFYSSVRAVFVWVVIMVIWMFK